ncbi:hypothetical protein Z947_3092 [Sulfitobacter geojensis]|nr:hypothetical protein Z947_3092 [Sulfitobacter geojensis]
MARYFTAVIPCAAFLFGDALLRHLRNHRNKIAPRICR